MAEKTVALTITTDSKQAEASVGSFKKQLKEANNELLNMAAKFGEASNEAVSAAKKVAGLKDAIGDAKALADTFNPDKKFVALGGVLQGVTAGFSALQGAIGLFGDENKELEKTLLKVQSAMALQQGISGLMEAKDSFGLLKDGAVRAFQAIKGAIGSTGIGLLVIALGTIVAYWDDIKEAVSGVSEEQKKLTKAAHENADAEQKKLKDLDKQDNILKLQGKSERDILLIKQAQLRDSTSAIKAAIVLDDINTKSQIAATTRNKEFLKGLLDLVFLPQKLLFEYSAKAINKLVGLLGKIGINIDFKINDQLADEATNYLSNLAFDPAKVQADADKVKEKNLETLKDLEIQNAGYKLSVKAIDQKAADESKAEQQKSDDEKFKKQKDEADANNKLFIKSLEDDKTAADLKSKVKVQIKAIDDAALLATTQKTAKELEDIEKAKADEERKDAKALFDQRIAMASDSLNIIGDILGKESAAGKAMAISSALINTYLGISAGVKLGYPAAIPAVLAAAATGFKAVKNIIGTKIPGKASGGGSAAGGSMSAPSLSSSTAPITPQAQTTTLSAQSINQIGVATSRAYVLESDVSSNQERTQRLNRAARIN